MPIDKRELYSSPNGDKWFLARDCASGNIFIRHEANVPSGGRMTEIDIGAFLSRGERNPEHQALLRLIGTLLERRAQDTTREGRIGAAVGSGRPPSGRRSLAPPRARHGR